MLMGFRSDDSGRVFVWNFKSYTRWWFQIFFISTSIWGKDPFCLIFLQMGGSTTNQYNIPGDRSLPTQTVHPLGLRFFSP